MATYRNDPPYLPSVYGRSPRAVELRRRYGAVAAVLLFFFGLLAAGGLAQLVAILLLVLIAGGAVFYLRDRDRREWLRLELARATRAADGLLRSGVARAGAVSRRGRTARLPQGRVRGKSPGRPPVAAVDSEAPTAEQTGGPRIPEPSLTSESPLLETERVGFPVGDDDALRCQAFGMRLRRDGHPDRAVPLHRSAQLIFEETGNRYGEALALNGLGLALAASGEPKAALRQFDRARTLLQELGDSQREGKVLVNLGLAKRQLGADDEAVELLRAAQARLAPGTYPHQLVEQRLRQPSSAT